MPDILKAKAPQKPNKPQGADFEVIGITGISDWSNKK